MSKYSNDSIELDKICRFLNEMGVPDKSSDTPWPVFERVRDFVRAKSEPRKIDISVDESMPDNIIEFRQGTQVLGRIVLDSHSRVPLVIRAEVYSR